MYNKEFENEIVQLQEQICIKYNAEYVSTPFDQIVGVALSSFEKFKEPINGLRHSVTNASSGWYIWAGTEFSTAFDFFKPNHTFHFVEFRPKVLKYLGLAPGWRFLIAENYEDVWFDENLLKV